MQTLILSRSKESRQTGEVGASVGLTGCFTCVQHERTAGRRALVVRHEHKPLILSVAKNPSKRAE